MAGSLPGTPRSLTRQGSSSSLHGAAGTPHGFVMPPEPPRKDQWVPDSSATVCMLCQLERFTMVGVSMLHSSTTVCTLCQLERFTMVGVSMLHSSATVCMLCQLERFTMVGVSMLHSSATVCMLCQLERFTIVGVSSLHSVLHLF